MCKVSEMLKVLQNVACVVLLSLGGLCSSAKGDNPISFVEFPDGTFLVNITGTTSPDEINVFGDMFGGHVYVYLNQDSDDAAIPHTCHSVRVTVYGLGGGDVITYGSIWSSDPDDHFDCSIYGGVGQDNITTDGGDDYIEGGEQSDIIKSGAGVDKVYGGSFNYIPPLSDGDDQIWSGGGFDEIYGGAGYDTLNQGGGNGDLKSSIESYTNPSGP